jgi:hypothetical protein
MQIGRKFQWEKSSKIDIDDLCKEKIDKIIINDELKATGFGRKLHDFIKKQEKKKENEPR